MKTGAGRWTGLWSADDGVSGGVWVAAAAGVVSLAVLLLVVIKPWAPSHPNYLCSDCEIAYSAPLMTSNVDLVVWLGGIQGQGQAHLTTHPDRDSHPAWSPDGTRLAFTTDRDNTPGGTNYEIYVMDADGANAINLTNNPLFDESPAWSPDGSRIVFASAWDQVPLPVEPTSIYVMDADGSNVVRLTTGRIWDRWPAWSPDGTRIAFASKRQFVGTTDEKWSLDYEIWLMDPDGGNPVKLTDNLVNDGYPDWSPDGSLIVYVSDGDIWIMDADGGNKAQLTSTPDSIETHPDWSPDGTEIAFVSDRDTGNQYELFVMSAGGTNVKDVSGFAAFKHWPDWRPMPTTAEPLILPPPDENPTQLSGSTTSVAPATTSTTTASASTTTQPVTTTAAPTTTAPACTPVPPVLLRPVDESTVSEQSPSLEWAYRQEPCVISGQTLQLAMDETFSGEVTEAEVAADDLSWVPQSSLNDCTTYHWRVAPAVDGATGPYSEISSFSTDFPKAVGCP